VRAAGAALVVVFALGCTETHWTALPYPIPLALSGPGGGLMARASVDGAPTSFPIVVDTGTVLTAYDDGRGVVRAHTGDFRFYGVSGMGFAIPRLEISNVRLFTTAIGDLGVDAATTPVQGVIGGDNLSRFAVAFDYRAAAPTMTVIENVQPCNCEFEPRVAQPDACDAVLAFSLAGGNDSALQSQTRILIGNDQYSYPPTRVLVDTCLEPLPDPLSVSVPGQPNYAICASNDMRTCPPPQYMPAGLDVRMIVATGFPGLALSQSAYGRLRGTLAADQLLAGSTVTLHLPDGADKAGIPAAVTTLGRAPATNDPGLSALALVSREKYYGPCTLLARSRRMRRAQADAGNEAACLLDQDHTCQTVPTPFIKACFGAGQVADVCNDDADGAPVPAVIEMTTQLPVYVIRDLAPLLVGINADVRPSDGTVEGVIGTEVLRRLVATVDYPGGRIIARCASDADCKAYSRLSIASPSGDCGFCDGNGRTTLRPAEAFRACPVAP
jgi:hypothetical protein